MRGETMRAALRYFQHVTYGAGGQLVYQPILFPPSSSSHYTDSSRKRPYPWFEVSHPRKRQ